MRPSNTIQFDVKHTLEHSSDNGSSWTIDVMVPQRFPIEKEVMFPRHRALLSEPLFVTETTKIIRHNHGSKEKLFRYNGYQHPKCSAVVIQLFSQCGRIVETSHNVTPEKAGVSHTKHHPLKISYPWPDRLTVVRLTKKPTFGIELELSDGNGRSRHSVAQVIERRTSTSVKVVEQYRDTHKASSRWKLVHDGSIECNRSTPTCSKFELVSPILRGEEGLKECHNTLQSLSRSSSVDILVNKSMGFHVHVSVEGFTLEMFKKLCKNFVEYEDAMDALMPPSRRRSDYCQSNKASIRNPCGTLAQLNSGRHRAIDACGSLRDLCALMNPKGRYYKLNMQNLMTGRQETVEFRQHSATAKADKVLAWARFCVLFVKNSASLPAPKCTKIDAKTITKFHALFNNLIQCEKLKNFYKGRMDETVDFPSLSISGRDGRAYCDGCARGRGCSTNHRDH